MLELQAGTTTYLTVQAPSFDTDFPTTHRETRTSRAHSQDVYVPSKPQGTLGKRRQKECKDQMIGRKSVKSHVLDKTQPLRAGTSNPTKAYPGSVQD